MYLIKRRKVIKKMTVDINCIINAHREGHVIHPTIASVKRAQRYAKECGLVTDVHVILDKADDVTAEIVHREMEGVGTVHEVAYGDLAFSRNHAAQNLTGKYLAFIDGDDLWGQAWLIDCYNFAENHPQSENIILHPEFNVIFGKDVSHVFNHIDIDAPDFEKELLLRMNCWTALSFALREIYMENPYQKNNIFDGFGYEDWTWNFHTIEKGFKHKVVPGTVHYIRKGCMQDSLLAMTNKLNAIPRILNIYKKSSYPQLRSVA